MSRVFYVDQAAAGGGDGSSAAPYDDYADALAAVSAGNMIIQRGNYISSDPLVFSNITVIADKPETVLQASGTFPDADFLTLQAGGRIRNFRLNGGRDVITVTNRGAAILDCDIDGTRNTRYGIRTGSASGVTIRRTKIHSHANIALYLSASSNLERSHFLEDVHLYNNSLATDVRIFGAANVTMSRCTGEGKVQADAGSTAHLLACRFANGVQDDSGGTLKISDGLATDGNALQAPGTIPLNTITDPEIGRINAAVLDLLDVLGAALKVQVLDTPTPNANDFTVVGVDEPLSTDTGDFYTGCVLAFRTGKLLTVTRRIEASDTNGRLLFSEFPYPIAPQADDIAYILGRIDS